RVERLLVPLAGRRLVAVAAMMPRQPEHAVGEAARVAQPGEGLEPDGYLGWLPERRSPDDERMGESRVVVREAIVEPQPRVRGGVAVGRRELLDEALEQLPRVLVETIGIESREAEDGVGGGPQRDVRAERRHECVQK